MFLYSNFIKITLSLKLKSLMNLWNFATTFATDRNLLLAVYTHIHPVHVMYLVYLVWNYPINLVAEQFIMHFNRTNSWDALCTFVVLVLPICSAAFCLTVWNALRRIYDFRGFAIEIYKYTVYANNLRLIVAIVCIYMVV